MRVARLLKMVWHTWLPRKGASLSHKASYLQALHYLNETTPTVQFVRTFMLFNHYRLHCKIGYGENHIQVASSPCRPHIHSDFSTCTATRNRELSFLGPADSVTASNAVQGDHSLESILHISNPNDILELAEISIRNGTLITDNLPLVFSRLRDSLYQMQTFPWLLPDVDLQKEQLQINFLHLDIVEPFTSDIRFKNLLAHTEKHAEEISAEGCLEILRSLQYFFVPSHSTLMEKLQNQSKENIESLDLQYLATVSSSLCSHPRDYLIHSKIANALKSLLQAVSPQDIDFTDLCCVFANMKDVISKEVFELGLKTIKAKLDYDSCSINLNDLSKICAFSSISDGEYKETLSHLTSVIDRKSLSLVDVTNLNLTFDIASDLGKNPELCPIINRVRILCVSELCQKDSLSIQDVVRYLLPLENLPINFARDKMDVLVDCVSQLDNLLLFQLMSKFSVKDIIQQPKGNRLLFATQLAVVQRFSYLNEDQLAELLWRNSGDIAKIVWNFVRKMSAKGIYVNEHLIEIFDKQLSLRHCEWDAPVVKVTLTVSRVVERLKLDNCLSPLELSNLNKLLWRLDFDDIVYHHKKLNEIFADHSVSFKAKHQARQLQKKLGDVFNNKLSHTKNITPSMTSSKIMPTRRYSKSRNSKVILGLYGDLVKSLPRFVATGNSINNIRALKILEMCTENVPIYQGEIFEHLIQFVTTNNSIMTEPTLHLLKVLALTGYQVDSSGSFMQWISQFIYEVLDRELLDRPSQVHLAYYLSLLGIFHDDLLLHIFSIDFLVALENELNASSLELLSECKGDLAFLNRSVAIECPHLAVSWFGMKFLPTGTSLQKSATARGMTNCLNQMCDGCVVINTKSPYTHHIDALLCLDGKARLVDVSQNKNKHLVDHCDKVAVVHLNQDDFCVDSDMMTGKCQSNIRQLQILGYTVILFSHHELSSMELQSESSLEDYMRNNINAVLGNSVVT